MSKYFDRFPLTEYNGETVRNILAKVDLSEQTKKDIYTYFEFSLQEGLTRPDILSNNYYSNPEFDWVFYLTNNVVDPYYAFYMERDNFVKYIEKKYGSEQAAKEKIAFYRNNWYLLEDSSISNTSYDMLDPTLQKYYKPILSNTQQVVRYERIDQDWTRSTNAVVELTVEEISEFAIGDKITQSTTSAVIRSIDEGNKILIVHHLTGAFVEGGLGDTSITNVNLIHRSILEAEQAFWTAVSFYDFEEEENEKKKQIFVLPKEYLSKFDSEFKEKISQ